MVKYDKLLSIIEHLINEEEVPSRLRANYAEYYVANELTKLGYEAEVCSHKAHDVEVTVSKNTKKYIEVKACGENQLLWRSDQEEGYEWSLQGKDEKKVPQQDKFDFIVLIGFKNKSLEINNIKDRNGKPIKDKKCIFIISRNEYTNFENEFFGTKYGITYEQEAVTKIEKDLEKNPDMHLEKWEKIK